MTEDRQAEGGSRLARWRHAATAVDSRPELLALAERLRARLPGDPRYGDRLSLAGREPHQLLGQGLSVIGPERRSVLNELGLTALQLWQAASEAQGRGRGQHDLTLLFCDLVGFSGWALGAGDSAAVSLLRAVADPTEGAIHDCAGRVVKRLGDGWMAAFTAGEDAVCAGLEIGRRLSEIEVEGYRPRMRVGLHTGRPRSLGGDYLGVDVNITARVAEAARPDQVLVTEPLARSLADDGRFAFARARRLRAQGAPRDLRVLAVAPA